MSKRGPKRTEFERERDYNLIAELYLKGVYQVDIAAQLDITQSQVSQDLKTIRRRWQKDTAMDLDAAKGRELARIDQLERTYWDAWMRSIGDHVKTRIETDDDGDAVISRTVVDSEHLVGDLRCLQGVQWCIDQRCKILGFYAPTKASHKVSVRNLSELTDEELQAIIDA